MADTEQVGGVNKKKSLNVKQLIYVGLAVLLILVIGVGVNTVKQEQVWTDEAQQVEDEFKIVALDYMNAYNQANPDNQIAVTQDIIGSYNQQIDTLVGWIHFEEFDAGLFSLATERMGYVSQYNTDLNTTLTGKIRHLMGVNERPYIQIMVDEAHN